MTYIAIGDYSTKDKGWRIPVSGGRTVTRPMRRSVTIDDIPYRDGYIEIPTSAREKRTLKYVLEQAFADFSAATAATEELCDALDVSAGTLYDGIADDEYRNVTCRGIEVEDASYYKRRVTVTYDADPKTGRGRY